MQPISIKNRVLLLLIPILFFGCHEKKEGKKAHANNLKKGYFVAPMEEKIAYQCGKKTSYLNHDGMFVCSSFPITFYVNNQPIGTITTLHQDGYVFPQDMLQQPTQKSESIRVASW